jgi:hypothetical protein
MEKLIKIKKMAKANQEEKTKRSKTGGNPKSSERKEQKKRTKLETIKKIGYGQFIEATSGKEQAGGVSAEKYEREAGEKERTQVIYKRGNEKITIGTKSGLKISLNLKTTKNKTYKIASEETGGESKGKSKLRGLQLKNEKETEKKYIMLNKIPTIERGIRGYISNIIPTRGSINVEVEPKKLTKMPIKGGIPIKYNELVKIRKKPSGKIEGAQAKAEIYQYIKNFSKYIIT